jgi:hypothetical protein
VAEAGYSCVINGTVENRISYPATKDRVPHPSRSLRRVGCYCSSPEAILPKLLLIPPFAENAKDGAPDPWWQGKEYGFRLCRKYGVGKR